MKSSEVVRLATKADGISQMHLAETLNYKTPSGVGNALSRENGMRVDVFIKIMKENTDQAFRISPIAQLKSAHR